MNPTPQSKRRSVVYLIAFLVSTIGSVWALSLFYLVDYEFAVNTLGELVLTNPIVVIILHSPALAAIGILLAYDGPRGLANFARTLVPRRRDVLWLPVLALIMLGYVFAVRLGCQAAGFPVPSDPMPPVDMVFAFLYLFYGEVGMVAIGIGWFGFFMPTMHRLTGSHVWSGAATGLGIAVFAAPGNLFSSFDLAMAWPVYAVQLMVLSVAMSYLLTRMKGNVVFFLVPFWVSASGSLWRMYHFTPPTQLIQITLVSLLALTLYLVLRRGAYTPMAELPTFPEYLEHDYTVRQGAVFPGRGNRSREGVTVPAGLTPAAEGAS